VNDAVSELQRRAVAQLEAKQEGARMRRVARGALLNMLRSIHRTARVIQAEQRDFADTFHLPERRSAQAVLTAARLAARGLDAVAEQFIEFGMPGTFAEDFKGVLETYAEAIRRQEVGKGETAAARASTDMTMRSAMTAVRQLDVIIANTLREDAAAMADWARGRRVSYARRVTATPSHSVALPATSAEDAENAEASAEVVERAESKTATHSTAVPPPNRPSHAGQERRQEGKKGAGRQRKATEGEVDAPRHRQVRVLRSTPEDVSTGMGWCGIARHS
jgi:hypothetical protein